MMGLVPLGPPYARHACTVNAKELRMSTTVTQPKNSPPSRNPTAHALVSLMQDPRQFRAWVGVTPNWLRAAVAAMACSSAIFALAIRHAAVEQSQTIKTIQEDSSPSIFAGQRLRASLADMHSNLANELLESGSGERTVEEEYTPEVKTGPANAAHSDLVNELLAAPGNPKQAVDLQDSAPTIFRKRRAEAARYLLAAAMNITYPGEGAAGADRDRANCRATRSVPPARESCTTSTTPRFLDAHQEADAIMQTKHAAGHRRADRRQSAGTGGGLPGGPNGGERWPGCWCS